MVREIRCVQRAHRIFVRVSAIHCTVTEMDLSEKLVTGVATETVVDPVCKGVKLVVTLSEPPGTTTDEAMLPVDPLLLFTVTVADCPPATCWI